MTQNPRSVRSRAQSEVVGVTLLVGIVAVLAILVGVLVIGGVSDDADGEPLADLNVTATPDNLTVTHAGGERLELDAVDVVVRRDTEERSGLGSFTERQGDGDDSFDPGERRRGDHGFGAGTLRVLVVHTESNTVLFDQSIDTRTPRGSGPILSNRDAKPRISYTPSDPGVGDTVTFDGSGSSDPDGSVVTYRWDLDDDGSFEGSGQTVTRSYASPGTYTVRLRVTDDDGATNTTTETVAVSANQPPVPNITYSPDAPGSGESISFDGGGSSDPDGSIVAYAWDWTDDGTFEGSGETASHTYGSPGRYTVVLNATDDDGASNTTARTVVVNGPPSASFVADCSDNTCTFDAATSSDDGTIANYTWAFDDGNTTVTDSETVSHTYASDGTYDVSMTVTDTFGATDTTTNTVDSNDAPVARFGRSCSGLTCTFDASNTTDADGTIGTYTWEFGDGNTTTTTDPTVEHTYASGGTYSVTLTATDTGGTSDSRTRSVEPNAPPNADYTTSQSSGSGGGAASTRVFLSAGGVQFPVTVLYDASASSDPDGTIVSYEWDFTDDGTPDASGLTASHVPLGLTLNTTLTVTDDDGASDSVTKTIPVQQPPVASFTVSPPAPSAGDAVTFDAATAVDPDGSIVAYEWDLDDDGTTDATGETATRTFASPGTYSVTLTVTDDDGLTDSVTQTVTVLEGTPPSITTPTLTDVTDGNGAVSAGDTIRVSATVLDVDSGVDTVTADATAFDAGTVALTDPNGDSIYSATATVGQNATEGTQSVTITATDTASNDVTATTGTLLVDTTAPTIDAFDVADDGSVELLFGFFPVWVERYPTSWTTSDANLASTTVTVNRSGTAVAVYSGATGSRTYARFGSQNTQYDIRIVAEDTAGNTACRIVEDASDGTDPTASQYRSCTVP